MTPLKYHRKIVLGIFFSSNESFIPKPFCTFRKYISVCETGIKTTIKVKTWKNLHNYNNNIKMPRICNKNEGYTLTNLCFCNVSAMV